MAGKRSSASEAGRILLRMRSLFPSAGQRDRVIREYGALDGAHQHLGRLAEYLKKMQ